MIVGGPHAIYLKVMGLDSNPWFLDQAALSEAYLEYFRNMVVISGATDWVDCAQSILE